MSFLRESLVKDFFAQNEKILLQNYPGLNFRIFSEFVQRYCLSNQQVISIPQELEGPLLAGVPFGQLLQECFFYDSYFYVDRNVLLPRPETELMVEKCMAEIKRLPSSSLIGEVGVGSGAVLLSIACEVPEHRYWGGDVSQEALDVAKFNWFLKKFPLRKTSIEFKLSDRLECVLDASLDFLISNPPYIMQDSDRSEVHPMVINHEPSIALFLKDKDYFSWFSDFFAQARKKLKSGASFWMEGHEKHLTALLQLALKMGYTEGEIIKDYTQRDRFLRLKN